MENVNERSALTKRHNELGKAIKRRGGARVTEEQELQAVRHKLGAINEAKLSADDASRALRCSLADFTPRGLDSRAAAKGG